VKDLSTKNISLQLIKILTTKQRSTLKYEYRRN